MHLQDGFPKEPFRLSITEYFAGRNKSEVTIKSCFSWRLTSEGSTSGAAMLVVDTPSGYILEQYEANALVQRKPFPELRDADTTQPGKTIWYFDRVPNETRCFEHTVSSSEIFRKQKRASFLQVKRYFPVANLTRTRQAVILESLRPEHFFVRTFNATSLYILSICEVCGSFQCPYCPFYSSALQMVPAASAIFALTFVILLLS